MPARQDQTLQIFLIIFIFAFLVTAVVAYLGWRNYGEADGRAVALKTSNDEKDAKMGDQGTELKEAHQWMAFDPEITAANAKTQYDADMKAYGSGIADADSRAYHKVLETVYAEGLATAAREAKLKAE